MRAKALLIGCVLLVIALSKYRHVSRDLTVLEQAYDAAGRRDLPEELLGHPTAERMGRTLRISAGNRLSSHEVEQFAESCARKRKEGKAWVAEFMRGYCSQPLESPSEKPSR